MARKKTTKKTTEEKKTTTTKKSSKKPKMVQLTFSPVAAGTKELTLQLRTKKTENRNGTNVITNAPLIEGLPMLLTVRRDEVIEVTEAQCAELEARGLVETKEEYEQRKSFVDNLKNQHPEKLSYNQIAGNDDGLLTMRDSQHKVYMDKLIRL
jgi:hypothetical protein